jgi:hypothetical protein
MAKGGSKMRVILSGFIAIMLLAGLGIAAAGCVPLPETKTGTVEVRVTDIPDGEDTADTTTQFEISSAIATVSEVKVYQTMAAQRSLKQEEDTEQGEWISLNITEVNPFNLLKLAGKEKVLASAEVEIGYYSQVSMTIDRLDVTISDGEERVIRFDKPFEFTGTFSVIAGETTTIILDFDIDKSVVIEDEKAVINPIAKITMNIRYEETETE